MFGKQATLIKLFGFDIKVDISWLFLAVLITWSLAQGLFPVRYEGYSAATYWWMAAASVIGIFFSLIFHELSHSLVARYYGLRIGGITLFLFGGVAEMEEEPARPRVEFLMAIAGPIASAVLSVGFYGVAAIGESFGAPGPAVAVVSYLGFLNLLLAAFNIIPAFPLDGGRVFRAALWSWKGDIRWATKVASRVGGVFALALMALGVLYVISGNFIGGMWWFLIGLFLKAASTASYTRLLTHRALEGQPVRRFMSSPAVAISPELTLHELVEHYVYEFQHEFFPVVADHHLIGCVTIRQIKEVPRDEWGLKTVSVIARPSSPTNTVNATDDAAEVLDLMQKSGNTRLMVVEDGQLVGVIALKDLLKLPDLKQILEGTG